MTGALPWFRYVLLTDALIEGLDDHQIEAVFGHEVGHIAHRHLSYFGFFFVGSMGVMALVAQGIEELTGGMIPGSALSWQDPTLTSLVVESVAALTCFGLYFLLIFGFLSRRFERQADVYGCRAVSCGRLGCPPHADLNAMSHSAPAESTDLCPVGIRIFANALSNVAMLNGMEPAARSWRHGSIRRRIAFLEGLEGKPDIERRFQTRVHWLRLSLALVLIIALITAVSTGAMAQL